MEEGPKAGADGHFVVAIKIGAFEDPPRFKSQVDQAILQIHECRKAQGVNRVYAPGELESVHRESCLVDGIPLNEVTLDDLKMVARELGVEAKELNPLD